MGKNINFTDDQVRKIFQLRAAGKTHGDIGEKMGCSASYIGFILARKYYGDVEVSGDLLESANHAEVKRVYKKRPKNGATPSEAIGNYTSKFQDLVEAENVAKKYFTEETLELVRVSLREGQR